MSENHRISTAPLAWADDFPVSSRYTFGLAGEKFFRALKDEGHILGSYCPSCDHTYVPGVLFCERCLAPLEEWRDVGTRGAVHTYTVLYVDRDGTRLAEPEIIALVKIADGGLVHKLGEVDPGEVFIGMPVDAVFKPASEREGSILDIRYFKPG